MTSRYLHSHGLWANGADISPDEELVNRRLADAGNDCGLVGKWQGPASCTTSPTTRAAPDLALATGPGEAGEGHPHRVMTRCGCPSRVHWPGQPAAAASAGNSAAAFTGVPRPVTGSQPVVAG